MKQTGIWQIEKELHIIKKGFHQWHGQNHLAGLKSLTMVKNHPSKQIPHGEDSRAWKLVDAQGSWWQQPDSFNGFEDIDLKASQGCDYPGKCEVGT